MMAKAGYTLGLFGFLLYCIGAYILIERKERVLRYAVYGCGAAWTVLGTFWLLLLIWLP